VSARAYTPPMERGTAGLPDLQLRLLEAREAERSILAQELHDGPAQVLANALFKLDLVDRLLERGPEAVRVELEALRRLLERELEQMRGYMTQLRPPELDRAGLDAALRQVALDVSEASCLPVTVQLDAPESALDEARQLVALRVAQEGLRNTVKHARAKRAWVTTSLRREADPRPGGAASWELEVGDDGQGILGSADDRPARRHFGLRFMRERAELIGASLTVDSGPGRGTRVRLTMPGVREGDG